jgi:hypothetical protein
VPDEEVREELKEIFDTSLVKGSKSKWPRARKEPPIERTHPETTPDLHSGPFEPLDGWRDDDEEIGYEGER